MRLIAILSPTDKWGTKTEYSRLRKFLLKDGHIRIGPEVFMRVVQNRKASEKHYRRIDEVKPKTGVENSLYFNPEFALENLIIKKKQLV